MPPTDHQQQPTPMAATAHAQTLASYHVDDTDRQLVAVHVPGEPTVRILDVLATPLPEDHDVDPIEIEPTCPPAEAQPIADDYARLARPQRLDPDAPELVLNPVFSAGPGIEQSIRLGEKFVCSRRGLAGLTGSASLPLPSRTPNIAADLRDAALGREDGGIAGAPPRLDQGRVGRGARRQHRFLRGARHARTSHRSPRASADHSGLRNHTMARTKRSAYARAMSVRTAKRSRERPTGIEIRHARRCAAPHGGECTCAPAFRAIVHSKRDGRKIQKTFPTLSAAQLWRQDALVDLRRGTLRASKPATVRQVGETWLQDAKARAVRNRSGDPYKPSVLRGYEQALRDYIYPELGGVRLGELSRSEVQDLADRLCESDLSASTVRNALLPLRAMCRRAYARNEIAVNPTRGLELPAVRGRRDRVAEPCEAEALIAALQPRDRALWATAMYAGLRRGELRALRWTDVDLATGVIHVRRTWDQAAGELAPKSEAGVRKVPVAGVLRDELAASYVKGRRGFAFGRADGRPFEPSSVTRRAKRAWNTAELRPITLHECRHTFASLMIAAGVNPKALQTFMGHTSITVTLDLYGHLFPGSEDEAAVLLDAYLERACAQARAAMPRKCGETVGKTVSSRGGLERR